MIKVQRLKQCKPPHDWERIPIPNTDVTNQRKCKVCGLTQLVTTIKNYRKEPPARRWVP